MATNYQSQKINAYVAVETGGVTPPVTLPIISCETSSRINAIPTATLQVSIGRDAKTGLASVSRYFDTFADHRMAYVYLKVDQRACSLGQFTDDWPRDPVSGENVYFKVFEGRIASASSSRSRDGASLRLQLQHWLADLEFSSAITRQAHQVTESMLVSNASYMPSSGVGPGFFPSRLAQTFFTPGNVQLDMWGSAFAPWLRELCNFDALSAPGSPISNFEALAAVNRIEPILVPDPNDPQLPPIPTYYHGVPLQLDPAGITTGQTSVVQAISNDLSLHASANMMATSLWSKLLEWAAAYDFAIIPLVSTAVIAPLAPGNTTPWASIYGRDYRHIDYGSVPPRPVRGIRLLGGAGSPAGLLSAISSGNANASPLFAGGYDNPDNPLGQILFQNAPRWASNVVSASLYSSHTLLPPSLGGSAVFPGLGPAPVQPLPLDIISQSEGLWDAYARAIYVRHALSSRAGSLQGRLRYDIAPGSTVRINAIAERFVRQQTGFRSTDVLFAEVAGVTSSFNSETMQASTAFQLMNIRDAYENSREPTSLNRHPLYSIPWIGAPLCELVLPVDLPDDDFP